LEYDLTHVDPEKYHPIQELFKWRDKALNRLDSYLELLKDQSDQDYIELIRQLKQKLLQMDVKQSDLKLIKFKI
jgi:hypothetical protein